MYSIGIDLGGTFTKIALVDAAGSVLRDTAFASCAGSPLESFEGIRAQLESLLEKAALPFPPPGGCGIGLPGVVDFRSGIVRFSGAFHWNDVGLRDIATQVLGFENIVIDNDVDAGALAELHFGKARHSSDMLYVSWGTGIGAAIVVNRRVYHSRGGAMGNFGHMPADPSSSRMCYCGCLGCLEVEAGGKALTELAAEAIRGGEESELAKAGEITPKRMAEATARGDRLAKRLLERAAVLIARCLAGILSLFNPDTVIFAGGVSQCFPLIESCFFCELARSTPRFSLPLTRIVLSDFGGLAGAMGAAMLPVAAASSGDPR
jgi:glucokinase